MTLAVLFPGQGTQHAQMLPWLDGLGSEALAPLVEAFGPHWRSRLADPEWVQRNEVAQPLITGLCLAAWHVLAPLLPAPAVIVGYSVGEVAAFHAAGVFGPGEAMVIAARRAALMDASVQGTETGLLSLVDAPASLVERLCRAHRLAVAIRFAPDRVIVGGERRALEMAAGEAAAAGAAVCMLAISIASHTPWMASAVVPFAAVLEKLPFQPPRVALVTDRDADVVWQVDALKSALAAQIAETIRWDDCMAAVAERGVTCVLEAGPGATLSRLWNARYPAVPARSIDEFRAPRAVARWVAEALA